VRDGDMISFDIPGRTLQVALDATEMAARLKAWRALPPRFTSGVMAKYARLVSSAAEGAITSAV
jgi:dihydroxy-acid dehydratase